MGKGAIGRRNNTSHGAHAENSDWFEHIGRVIKDKIEDKIEAR